MTIDVDDLHPLTTWRILLAVLIALAASVLAIGLALALLFLSILSGGGTSGPTLGATVHTVVHASSSWSRPLACALSGGTAQLESSPRPDDRGEGALPPAPGPRPDFSRRPGGVA